jgi:hypothetical protein
VLLGVSIPNELPYNDFFEYYAPDFKLHLTPTNMENMNKRDTLDNITARILQNLKNLQGAPSVQMHPVPPDWVIQNQYNPQEEEDNHPDKRPMELTSDGALKRLKEDGELFGDDKDNDQVMDTSGEKKGGRQYLTKPSPSASASSAAAADNDLAAPAEDSTTVTMAE